MTGINLFIGAGGSGSATLRWLYHDLKQRLIANGWPWDERAAAGHAMPRCWRFIEIDVDSTGNPTDVPEVPANSFRRIILSSEPDQMNTIYNMLRANHLRPELNGWLPQLSEMAPFNPFEGAGQYRAIGRAVFLARGGEALEAIRDEAVAATGVDAGRDLALLGSACGLDVSANERRAVLVSSLSGGSGSGMWLDIAQWLNGRPAVQNEAWMSQQLYTFLYLPEVHELISGPTDGLMPNGMLSAVEMLSAYADRAPYDDVAHARLTTLGIGSHTYSTKAPRNLFLVGRAGTGGVAYERVGQVYAVTSRTIGALAFSYGKGFSRVSVNEQTPPPQVPLLRVADHVTSSNIGYSRIDLGRQALMEYSVRRVFRSTMLQLLEGHGKRRLNDFESDEDAIRRLADGAEHDFFVGCGLHERDSDLGARNDQVLDAILSRDDAVSLADSFERDLSNAITELFAAVRDKSQRQQQVQNEFPSLKERYVSRARLMMMKNAADYAEKVRVQTLSTLTESMAEYSVPVAAELLRRLDKQLDDALSQLTEATRNDAGTIGMLIENFYENVRDRISKGREAALRSVQAERRKAAAAFIREVQTNLIEPAIAVLDGWSQRTRTELELSEMRSTVFDWNGVEPQDEFVPPPNAVMIETPEGFDARFQRLIESTMSIGGEPRPFQDALRAAIVEITSHCWPEVQHDERDAADVKAAGQLFLRPTGQFGLVHVRGRLDGLTADSPPATVSAAFDWFTSTDVRGSRASFTVATWRQLLGVTRVWCSKRSGSMSRYLAEGFGKWLDPQHPEHASRARLFAEQFERAVRSAAPLVQYDNDVFTNVVSANAMGERLIVEPDIPVSGGGPIANDLIQRVGSVHRDLRLEASDFSVGGRDTSQIELMRSFDQGMHPLAFSSLTRAIKDGFGQGGDRFWSFRRARPLAHSLGLSPAQVVALVRGWVVVRILNLLDQEGGRVWLGDGWMTIPQERLRGAHRFTGEDGLISPSNWLQIALESLPLRLMNYPYDTKSLDFYIALASLGGYSDGAPSGNSQESTMNSSDGGVGSQAVRRQRVTSELLRLWIDTGVVAPGAPTPTVERAGAAGGSKDERRDAVVAYLDHAKGVIDPYLTAAVKQDGEPEPGLVAEQQLALQFSTAIEQLRHSCATDGPVVAGPSNTGI